MNLLSNIAALPRITLKELQQRARNSHPNTPISPNSKQTKQNHYALKVVSPFYHKHKHNQPKCDCEFHKLKKTHLQHEKHPNKKLQLASGHINKLDLSAQIQPTEITSTAIKGSYLLNRGNSKSKLLQPLPFDRTDYLSELQQQTEQKYLKSRNSDKQQVQRSYENSHSALQLNGNSQHHKSVLPTRAEVAYWRKEKSIDTTNLQFIALISRRLQNQKYKKGYLKTLFSFIKMKSYINKFYMYHSKAYLANSLNVLLNHYTMQQLATPQLLEQHQVQRIAFHMGCHHKQVQPILNQLAQAVSQMETFLNELRQKEANKQQLQLTRQDTQANLHLSLSHSRKASSLQKIDDALNQPQMNRYNESNISRMHSRINLLTEQSDNEHLKRSTKGSTVSLRKSILKSTLQFGYNNKTTIDLNQQRQLEKLKKQTNENQPGVRNSQIMASTLPLSIGRSPRSTVFVINQCRGESRQSTIIKKGKQGKRKFKATKLPAYIDPYEKYSNINYLAFCSKRQFMQLVDELERLDQNDQQRAHKVFQMLKAEQFIEDADKLDLMITTFSPLFSQNCKEKLLKHIVLIKDRRYIQKLSKELDFLLGQIKRTDPRNFSNQDLCPYKEDPILKNQFTQRIIPLKQQREQHLPILRKMVYQEHLHKVNPNRFTESEANLQLKQTELSSIRAQRVEPMLYQSIYFTSTKPNKQERVFVRQQNYSGAQQKKILQYMRQKHPNSFDYLSTSISTLCSKLTPANS